VFAASEQPELVRALALVSPAGAKVDAARLQQLIADLDVRTWSQARAMTQRLFHEVPLALKLFAPQLKYLYGSQAVRGALQALTGEEHVPLERFEKLVMPTLLLWGKSERLLPYEGIEYFRASLPEHAEVYEVPGFGHVPQMEKPLELVEKLVAFARRARII
jgi:pimeloyl-ACP methyl ester carboxylesterase